MLQKEPLNLLPKKLFISTKDVIKLRGYKDYKAAYYELRSLADILGKPSIKCVTILEYCDYNKVNPAELYNVLNRKPVAIALTLFE